MTMDFTTMKSTSMLQNTVKGKASASSTEEDVYAMAVGAPSETPTNQAAQKGKKGGGECIKWKREILMDVTSSTSLPIAKPWFGAMESNTIRPAKGRRRDNGSGGQRMAKNLRGAPGHTSRSSDYVEEDEALDATRLATFLIALYFMFSLRFNVFEAEPLGSWLFANG